MFRKMQSKNRLGHARFRLAASGSWVEQITTCHRGYIYKSINCIMTKDQSFHVINMKPFMNRLSNRPKLALNASSIWKFASLFAHFDLNAAIPEPPIVANEVAQNRKCRVNGWQTQCGVNEARKCGRQLIIYQRANWKRHRFVCAQSNVAVIMRQQWGKQKKIARMTFTSRRRNIPRRIIRPPD